jgi:hypothetical protein
MTGGLLRGSVEDSYADAAECRVNRGDPRTASNDTCIIRYMTPEEAEAMLVEWRTVVRSRNERVRAALAAGLTKHRISVVSGISRATIDRLLASGRDEASDVQH